MRSSCLKTAVHPELESALANELQEAGVKNTDRATRAANREAATAKIATLRESVAKLPERVADMQAAAMATYDAAETMYEQQIAELQRQIEKLRGRLGDAHTALQASIEADEARLRTEAEDMHATAVALQTKLDGFGTTGGCDRAARRSWPVLRSLGQPAEACRVGADAGPAQRVRRQGARAGQAVRRARRETDCHRCRETRAIESAKLPVAGLDIGDGYLTLAAPDGSGAVPWDQASESRRAAASFDLAVALNPPLKAVLIRSGSGISKKTRAYIQQRAAEKGYNVVLEVVDEGEGTTVVIEDGHVRGAPDEPPAEAPIGQQSGDAPVSMDISTPDLSGWRT